MRHFKNARVWDRLYLPGPRMCCPKAASMYRAHFCGLGTNLHRHYGLWARGLVNRDSTFLTLLGGALTRDAPSFEEAMCCNPLATPRALLSDGPVIQYAGAVTLCALNAKLDDDVLDEHGWRRWLGFPAWGR